jgi:hypothetical protein
MKKLLLLIVMLAVSSCTVRPSYVGTYSFYFTPQAITRSNSVTGEIEVLTKDGWIEAQELIKSVKPILRENRDF